MDWRHGYQRLGLIATFCCLLFSFGGGGGGGGGSGGGGGDGGGGGGGMHVMKYEECSLQCEMTTQFPTAK